MEEHLLLKRTGLENVVLGIALAGLAVALFLGIRFWLDLPEVRVSTGSGQCVEVLDPAALADGRQSPWDCDNLPPKYHRVWVQ